MSQTGDASTKRDDAGRLLSILFFMFFLLKFVLYSNSRFLFSVVCVLVKFGLSVIDIFIFSIFFFSLGFRI